MKLLRLSTFILVSGISCCYSQSTGDHTANINWDDHIVGQKFPGFIISNNGDTVKGSVLAHYPGGLISSHQLSCIFFKNGTDTSRVKYRPDDIRAYQIADKFYVSMNYSGGLTTKIKNFVLSAKMGGISEHIFYTAESGFVMGQQASESRTQYYNRIYTNKMVYSNSGASSYDIDQIYLAFRKRVAELVYNYPELAKKIELKEKGYGMLNFQKIVDEYNAWFLTKKSDVTSGTNL